jgi:4-hydroxyphenylacetate 3-monooxygenase
MVGSEFAGRHLQYEKFYAGASFIIRNHSYRETDWGEFNRLVEDLMASYDYRAPEDTGQRQAAAKGARLSTV